MGYVTINTGKNAQAYLALIGRRVGMGIGAIIIIIGTIIQGAGLTLAAFMVGRVGVPSSLSNLLY